jgi:NodT family efflux transporter outer membrane factor (OMF) lipoprotein
MVNLRPAVCLFGGVFLASCTSGPDFLTPATGLPQTTTFDGKPLTKKAITAAETIDPDWWKAFHDPTLTSLEARVAEANLDIKTAALRIAESRAQLSGVASAEFPTLNGTAKVTREQYSQNGIASLLGSILGNGGGASKPIEPITDHTTGFDASWELDLWGRVKRQIEAADADVTVSEEQRHDALISVQAEVARDYIQLRGAQALLANANENLQIERDLLKLTQDRQAKGVTTGLDVENAAAQVEAIRAQIPDFEQQKVQQINALSFLMDLPPNGLGQELARARSVPPAPARVPTGIPSELAERRPDIRRADAALHEATANIGVAEASFYPSVQLNGSVDLDALEFYKLFRASSVQYNFGPSVSIPIFEGGKLKAMLDLSETRQKEAAITYHKTVLQAWHDVVNTLSAYRFEQQKRSRLAAQVEHARAALGLARTRYNDGVADFTTVLDTARTVNQAEQQYVQSTVNVSVDAVQLYKALGGGWQQL